MNLTKTNSPTIILFAFLSMVFWGLSFVWSKVVFDYYNPITTITLRLSISTVLLFLFLYFFMRREIKSLGKSLKLFVLLSFFEPFLYFIGESYGLKKVDATITAVIISTIPVFTALIGFYFLKERLSFVNFLGIFISCSGVIIMMLNKEMKFSAPIDGILLVFLAVFAAINYGVVMKKIDISFHPIFMIAVQNLIGTIWFLPLFLIFGIDNVKEVEPNFKLISSLIFLSIFASSLAFILYTYVVRNLGLAKANIYTNFIPIFTAVGAFFILNEQFTTMKIIGILVAIFGVYLSQRTVKIRKSGKLPVENQPTINIQG